jgi:hypothetical protein
VERAKNILLGDILGSHKSKRNSNIKHVRMSLDVKNIFPKNLDYDYDEGHAQSLYSHKSSIERPLEDDNESLENYLQRHSLSRSSQNSTGLAFVESNKKLSKPNILPPKFIMDNMDDEKISLKYSNHSIEIEIIKLDLCESSPLSSTNRFLYVEYSFLDYKGYLLETQSLPLPKKRGDSMFYGYKRQFQINPTSEEEKYKSLQKMLEKKSKCPLKFLIISEPMEKENDYQGECEEVA